MVRLGETADEYALRRGSDDEVWIKGFKAGTTRIRICQPVGTWTHYRDHFVPENEIGYTPCGADYSLYCPACEDPRQKVKDRNHRYAFNALDEQGRVNVYRVGSKMKRTFEGREQRNGSVMDRDYLIIRSGSGFSDTAYDIDSGEKYDVPLDGVELHDIPVVLGEKYTSTLGAFETMDAVDATDTGEGTAVRVGGPADEETAAPAAGRIVPGGGGADVATTPSARITPGGETVDDQVAREVAAEAEAAAAEEPAAEETAPVAAVPAEQVVADAAKPAAKKAAPAKKTAAPPPAEEPTAEQANGDKPDYRTKPTAELVAIMEARNVEVPPRTPRSRLVAMCEAGTDF